MLSNTLKQRDTTGAFALMDSLVRHQCKTYIWLSRRCYPTNL